MNPRQGDIVLVPAPFTDLSSHKRRPVVILSSDVYNDASPDFIVVAMTSTPVQTRWSLPITNGDLRSGRLNRPGTVRADKIYTLAQSLAVSRFGTVTDEMLGRIREKLLDALGASVGRRGA